MIVTITLTVSGSDTGPSFDLYSDVDGFGTPFETGVSRAALIAGYTSSLVPDGTSSILIQSTGVCTNGIYVSVIPYTTTTSTTSTSTSTTTTSSTTATPFPEMRVNYYTYDSVYTQDVADAATINMLSTGSGNLTTIYSISIQTQNIGDATLTISSVSELDDVDNLFQMTANPTIPYDVLPSFLGGFTIEFNGGLTATAGTYEATFEISSNDPTYPDFAFTVTITVA